MEDNYTGGDWKVINSPKYHEPKSSTIEIHSKGSQGWIAKIQNNGIIRHKEGLANAKLIAAAPDLLEALLNIENDDNSIPKTIWDLRNAAIKKALG